MRAEPVVDPFVWRILSPAEPQTPMVRYGHSSVIFDGCMYVFGGFNPELGTLGDVWAYHFDSNVWTELDGGATRDSGPDDPRPAPRFYHSAVVYRRAMYVFGGHSGHGGTYYADVHCFDLDSGVWTEVQTGGTVPAGRRSHTAVVWPDEGCTELPGFGSGVLVTAEPAMYVFGGFCGTHHSSQIHRLSFVTWEWECVATSCPDDDEAGGPSDLTGDGQGAGGDESLLLAATPSLAEESMGLRRRGSGSLGGSRPNGLPPALKAHTAVVHDGSMYVFGGQTEVKSRSAQLLQYEFATRVWTRLEFEGEAPELRSGHISVVHHGEMYVFGGRPGERGAVWRVALHPQQQGLYTWARLDCRGLQPRSRSFASAVVYNDRIVVFGGYANDVIKKRKHFRNDLLELGLDPIVVPPPTLDTDLRAFLGSRDMADVVFRVGVDAVEMPAHKIILCARSETFRVMFRNPMRESLEGVVYVPEVEPDVFSHLLEFIYTSQVRLRGKHELAAHLIPLAELYALPRLKALCIDTLRTAICIENVVYILMLADLYMSQGLKRLCLDYMVAHLPVVRQLASFSQLKQNPELLFEVMQRFGVAVSARHP